MIKRAYCKVLGYDRVCALKCS